MNQSCSCSTKPKITKPVKPENLWLRHHIYDFSNEDYDVNGPFEKCVNIFSGVNVCVRLVPAELKGTVAVTIGSLIDVNVAAIQYEVGGPVTLTFGIEYVGSGIIRASLSTDEETGKHSVVLDYLIEGPFGIDITKGVATIKLPF